VVPFGLLLARVSFPAGKHQIAGERPPSQPTVTRLQGADRERLMKLAAQLTVEQDSMPRLLHQIAA